MTDNVVSARHEVMPRKGTTRSVATGEPCELTDQRAYPVAALCKECGQPATSAGYFLPFYHDSQRRGAGL
ncbi:MAG: hypothetical protein J2P30_01540 [Actinobacteria bacterium]|nr:hypothetical protein [Actinomycetota bacterium]